MPLVDMCTGSPNVFAANPKKGKPGETTAERMGREMNEAMERWKANHPGELPQVDKTDYLSSEYRDLAFNGDFNTQNPKVMGEIIKYLDKCKLDGVTPTTARMLDIALEGNGGNMTLATGSVASALHDETAMYDHFRGGRSLSGNIDNGLGHTGKDYYRWIAATFAQLPTATRLAWQAMTEGEIAAQTFVHALKPGTSAAEQMKLGDLKKLETKTGQEAVSEYKKKEGPASRVTDHSFCQMAPATAKPLKVLINSLPAHTVGDIVACNHACVLKDGLDGVLVGGIPLVVGTPKPDAPAGKSENERRKKGVKPGPQPGRTPSTPQFDQAHDNSCGQASVRDVIATKNGIAAVPSEDELIRQSEVMDGGYNAEHGTYMKSLPQLLKDNGVYARITYVDNIDQLRSVVAGGNPAILQFDMPGISHFMVLDGVTPDGILLVRDPAGVLTSINPNLDTIWRGFTGRIVATNIRPPGGP